MRPRVLKQCLFFFTVNVPTVMGSAVIVDDKVSHTASIENLDLNQNEVHERHKNSLLLPITHLDRPIFTDTLPFNTLQEHQTIPTNATLSKVSDTVL